MKALFVAPILFLWVVALLLWAQLASAFTVFRPDGLVQVQPTGHGFNVLDMRKNTITSVTKTSKGYVIFPQEGEPTFIRMNPGNELLEQELVIPSLADEDLL